MGLGVTFFVFMGLLGNYVLPFCQPLQLDRNFLVEDVGVACRGLDVGVIEGLLDGLQVAGLAQQLGCDVRGASAPSMVFTRTGGDVALGVMVSYEGSSSTPLDGVSATTLSASSTLATQAG